MLSPLRGTRGEEGIVGNQLLGLGEKVGDSDSARSQPSAMAIPDGNANDA